MGAWGLGERSRHRGRPEEAPRVCCRLAMVPCCQLALPQESRDASPSCPHPPGCPRRCRGTPTPRGRHARAPCRCMVRTRGSGLLEARGGNQGEALPSLTTSLSSNSHNSQRSSCDASRWLGVGRSAGRWAPPPPSEPHLSGLKRTATHTLFFCEPFSPSYCTICVMAANYRPVGPLETRERLGSPFKVTGSDAGLSSGRTRRPKAKAETRRPVRRRKVP